MLGTFDCNLGGVCAFIGASSGARVVLVVFVPLAALVAAALLHVCANARWLPRRLSAAALLICVFSLFVDVGRTEGGGKDPSKQYVSVYANTTRATT